MWLFGQEAEGGKSSKSTKSLRDENEALKRELKELRQKGQGSSSGGAAAPSNHRAAAGQPKGSPKKKASPPQKASKPIPPGMKPAADAFNGALEPAIKTGDILYVQALVNKPEFNGRLARVVSHDPAVRSVFIEGGQKSTRSSPNTFACPRRRSPPFGICQRHPEASIQTSRKMHTSRAAGPRKLTEEEREMVQARRTSTRHPKAESAKTERIVQRCRLSTTSRLMRWRSGHPLWCPMGRPYYAGTCRTR